ncbi:LuxR family maltose regulon positive regulatory protein [Arthrobacter ginsengisoli]|uniref:LuxR family maltose regulon positive regulatory protein n=1 Tax=Arthrobacter ginsengisoli TaxID=1356565 RepID=A0ABU1UEW4_9MICC|nr:LuxR C-terminal-related transcriptional regulator [Arthrobacter ginsengisoli]MDR7083717.1 LuxR family maltose regulon positive regulatory protein [Arthrobacter ginsengisoli]
MPTRVLATKLHVPVPRPQAVPRPHLLKRLDEGFNSGRRLTAVSAPAGFGKTTLLSEWIAHRRGNGPDVRVGWLSLDEGDNEPPRFLGYVLSALQNAEEGIGAEAVGLLQSSSVLPVEAILTVLINDVARAGRKIILVLDDYHVITAPAIHEALIYLLDHLPSQLHLALATRSDPPLGLARLRARGELTELRAADLRFTPQESADFLNDVMGLRLSAGDIAGLDARTEGWIAGLQLAALSMRGHQDSSGFIRAFTGSHRFIIDYLVEEVLQRQTDDVRSFLLDTAVLDRMTGPLSEAVTGQTGGSAMLETLDRGNLFVVPLDDCREWYRYHHLFAEVLRSHLQKEQPERVPALHLLASGWYDRNDMPEDAVKHALSAADFERAAGLIEATLPAIRRGRQDSVLLGWLKQLPDQVVRRRPVLSVFYAWMMLVTGDLEAVGSRLRDAEQGLDAAARTAVQGDEFRMLPVTIAIYRASLAQALGDVAGTAEHARRALKLAPPGDHLSHGAAAGFLGLAAWAGGDLLTAVPIFSKAVTSLHMAGNIADELGSTIVLADMLTARGRPLEARRLYEQAIQLAVTQGESVPLADLHVGISELHCEFGDPVAAARHLQTSTALGTRASLTENRYRRLVALARVREIEDDPDGAIGLLDEAERLYIRGFLPEVRPIAAKKARIRITQLRLSEARDWIRERGLSATDDISYLREYEHLTLARLLIAEYRLHRTDDTIREALLLLDRLLEAAEASGRSGSVNEILVLQAISRQERGHLEPALVSLEQALVQAGPEGYVRLFLDEGKPMQTLLGEAGNQGIAPEHVGRLLLAYGTAAADTPTAPLGVDPVAELLSKRELQVLKLFNTPLSGPEIARELFVSVNTLRTHTKHIFSKLDVSSRAAAVHRAQELRLI